MAQRKILILTNRIPYPLKDGGNLAMDAMVMGYHRAGWQVFLLSMNTSRHHVAHQVLEKLYPELFAFEWVNVDNDIKMVPLLKNFLFSKKPEHLERFTRPEFGLKLKQVMDDFMPDVVQVESIFLSGYLPIIKKHPETVTALRMHNIEYHIWQSLASKMPNFLKRYYFKDLARRIRKFERSAWNKYDLLLPITHKDAHALHKLHFRHDALVVPFGIDVAAVPERNVAERWVGYHIGAMDWIPNREGVLWFITDVWPRIHKVLPKFEFYFAGRDMPESMKKIKKEGVFCMNEVPSAEDFIADKKILIVPLGSGSGIRVKILEAMAAGKIVISTVHGIKGIEAKNGEHYLLANRPEDFVRALKWVSDNRKEAETMAQNGRRLVCSKYDVAKITGEVTARLEAMLVEKHSEL